MSQLESFSTDGLDPRRRIESMRGDSGLSGLLSHFLRDFSRRPDLTPMRVAETCKMTPRYLHHLRATAADGPNHRA